MNKKPFIAPYLIPAVALIGSWLGANTPAQAAPKQPITIAILEFTTGDELAKDTGSKIAALVITHLSAHEHLIPVERAELDRLLGEQELGLSGTVTDESAAEVSRLTGAKVLVTGRVFSDGSQLVAVGKIMGVETSRVYAETARQEGIDTVSGLAEDLAGKIARRVSEKADTLLAKAVPKEQRIAALIRSLPEGKRPVVAVHLPEHHFGRQVADPAAATEFLLILAKAGFTVVDKDSNQRPDLELKGEAFSALGMRKGNLVSCKARIEIKILDPARDKILAVDRQTSVAVDITEQTAAKTALEMGALALAERNLAKLLN